jgi:endonuclease I
MKKLLLFWLIGISFSTYSQIPPGYYNSTSGLSGEALQQSLYNIIKDHNVVDYSDLWEAFELTDKKSNGKVWDIYSDVPGGTPPYQYTFGIDQCGNYSGEGDCFNREHSFPRSWFGGDIEPMESDLFHVYPTDGFVNNKRGNDPYGEVNNPSWTSLNGSKSGNNTYPGYSGVAFEPIAEYKGDLARSYFYMATRYYNEDGNWPGSPMTDGAQLKEWALNMLFEWHENDPVSQKEINRNNAVYSLQYNRNPFIDHPEFAENIWFYTTVANSLSDAHQIKVYPNPAGDVLFLEHPVAVLSQISSYIITDPAGRIVLQQAADESTSLTIDISQLKNGLYFFAVSNGTGSITIKEKIIKY